MIKYLIAAVIVILIVFFGFRTEIFPNKTILLGASLPKTGIMKDWGISVYTGANAYFKYANKAKLLPKGKEIRFISLDDKYEPELTNENTQALLKRKDLFALFGYVGTPTVKNILPILDQEGIPFIAPFSGASFLREKANMNFVNFRSSYKEEIDKIVGYLYEKKDITKFSVFYQNDNYGEEGYISLIKSLKKRNLKLEGEGTYKRNTLSIKHAFSEIKNARSQAVIMIGAYKANALFIKKAKEDKQFKDVLFCNISFGDANQVIKELNFDTKNLIFSQVVPSYNDYNIDVIKEYKYLMKKYFPNEPLSFISLEAFLAAKSVVSSLQMIKGNITREKFLKSFRELPKDTFKGMEINYKNTQLLNKVYLFEYYDSKFREIKYED